MYHGYPENAIPPSCSCKIGTLAEEAMRNLNGTFIDVWTPEHDAAIKAEAQRVAVLDTYRKISTFKMGKRKDGISCYLVPVDYIDAQFESLRRGEP